jgi:hypothetical protein
VTRWAGLLDVRCGQAANQFELDVLVIERPPHVPEQPGTIDFHGTSRK